MEVLMLRRSGTSHFVPDAYVFPGGTLAASDVSDEAIARSHGTDGASLRAQFRVQSAPSLPSPGDAPTARESAGLLIAAVRELFEEAGVLLACDTSGKPCTDRAFDAVRDRLLEARRTVQAGTERFDALLAELDVYANAAALALFSQWITPPVYPRRYNAHFFVALARPDQAASADALETHDGIWIAPQDALDRAAAGTLHLVYPTIKHVERLAAFASPDDLMAFARTKPIYRVMPQTHGEHRFALPPELEHAW